MHYIHNEFIINMKRLILKLVVPALIGGCFSAGFAQEVDKKVINWYNNHKQGMGTDKALKKLKKRTPDTVIVAVIDSGIEVEHDNLKGKIWVNKGEIPGNGIDDDGNGYVDDVHGWNFLGNKNGENQGPARLEVTRIYASLKPKFDGVEAEDVNEADRKDYELYLKTKEEVEKNVEQYKQVLAQVENLPAMEPQLRQMVASMLGKDDFTEKDLKKYKPKDAQERQFVALGKMIVTGEFKSTMEKQKNQVQSMLDHHYNVDYDDRGLIGDDPMDINDRDYGNNDYQGPDALHGTHVGGIIGAVRGNKLGNDGVAPNVQLMSLRAVPDGDEFDKDIALAIRYAVDNGAKIINASFGKAYSVMPEVVYEALRYAEENDVLFVHAAGNSAQDLHEYPNYPANMFPFQSEPFTNYMSIGASTREHEEELAARFSNYGKTRVDVFAPGFEIYSTVPTNTYLVTQGTSMAAPMVSGVAAIIKGYFPELTMAEVREVIMESATDFSETMQKLPGSDELVRFGDLSVTGGVVNVIEAVKLAEQRVAAKQ